MSKMTDRIKGKVDAIEPRPVDATLQPPKAAPSRLYDAITQGEPLREKLGLLEKELNVLRKGTVQMDQLTEIPGRRRQLSKEDFEALVANLAVNPLIHPIVVRPMPNGLYEVVAGHNRVDAYRQLGREEIPATVQHLEGTGTAEAFYSNLFVSELSDYEKFKGFRLIQQETGDSQVALAQKAGVSKGQIAKLFAFEKLLPDAVSILEQFPGLIGANRVHELAKAKPERIFEALQKLSSGQITHQEAAVAFALKEEGEKPAAKQVQNILVKKGKIRFAEIAVRGNTVNVRFKNEDDSATLLPKITELLREYAQQHGGAGEEE